MQQQTPAAGEGRADASPPGGVADDRRCLDRRTLIRGAGAVFAAGALAGCSDDEEDDGSGESDDDGGGPYAVGGRAPVE